MVRRRTAHTRPVQSLAVSPDGGTLATGGGTGSGGLRLWDAATGALLHPLQGPHSLTVVAFSPDGKWLATGAELRVLPGLKDPRAPRQGVRGVTGVAFRPHGRLLAAASYNTVAVWDLKGGETPTLTLQTDGNPGYVTAVAFSPDGSRLAVASRLMVTLLDAATGEEVLILRGRSQTNPDTNAFNPRVRFSPDGKRIAAICHDIRRPVSLWAVEEDLAPDAALRLRAADRRAVSAPAPAHTDAR